MTLPAHVVVMQYLSLQRVLLCVMEDHCVSAEVTGIAGILAATSEIWACPQRSSIMLYGTFCPFQETSSKLVYSTIFPRFGTGVV